MNSGRGRHGDDDRDEARRGRDDDDDDNDRRGRGGLANLGQLFSGNRARGGVAKAEAEANSIEVTYTDGWKEEVEDGRYELKDPSNRTVVERAATAADFDRLNSAF